MDNPLESISIVSDSDIWGRVALEMSRRGIGWASLEDLMMRINYLLLSMTMDGALEKFVELLTEFNHGQAHNWYIYASQSRWEEVNMGMEELKSYFLPKLVEHQTQHIQVLEMRIRELFLHHEGLPVSALWREATSILDSIRMLEGRMTCIVYAGFQVLQQRMEDLKYLFSVLAIEVIRKVIQPSIHSDHISSDNHLIPRNTGRDWISTVSVFEHYSSPSNFVGGAADPTQISARPGTSTGRFLENGTRANTSDGRPLCNLGSEGYSRVPGRDSAVPEYLESSTRGNMLSIWNPDMNQETDAIPRRRRGGFRRLSWCDAGGNTNAGLPICNRDLEADKSNCLNERKFEILAVGLLFSAPYGLLQANPGISGGRARLPFNLCACALTAALVCCAVMLPLTVIHPCIGKTNVRKLLKIMRPLVLGFMCLSALLGSVALLLSLPHF